MRREQRLLTVADADTLERARRLLQRKPQNRNLYSAYPGGIWFGKLTPHARVRSTLIVDLLNSYGFDDRSLLFLRTLAIEQRPLASKRSSS